MRHYKKGRKLGTDASHTKAIKKNLAVALFTNDRIKTTVTRAKEVRGDVDRIITWAKKGDLHSRRLAIAALGDKELVREVFEKAEQGMWADRNGGYTRILKLGPRKGDNAPMAILELVLEAVPTAAKKEEEKPAKKAAKKSAKDNSEALEEEVATSHEQDAELEAEVAEDEAAIEEEALEEAEAEVEAEEAEKIAEIAEETAEEQKELIEEVDAVAADAAEAEEAVEKAEKHED